MSNFAKRAYGGLLTVADIESDAYNEINSAGGVEEFLQARYDSIDTVEMQTLQAYDLEWSTSEEDWPESVVFYFKGSCSQEAEEEPKLEEELKDKRDSVDRAIKAIVAAMGIEAPLKFGTYFWCVSDY